MYIYVYAYVYIYICIWIYKYICIHIYIYIYLYTNLRPSPPEGEEPIFRPLYRLRRKTSLDLGACEAFPDGAPVPPEEDEEENPFDFDCADMDLP